MLPGPAPVNMAGMLTRFDMGEVEGLGGGLPTGTVTFVLGDVVGSTRLWQEHGEAMPVDTRTTEGYRPVAPLWDNPEAAFDEVVGANLRTAFLALKHVVPHIRDGGAIVNLASALGVVGAEGMAGYAAAMWRSDSA